MVSLNIWRCANKKCPNIQPGIEAQKCPECGCKFKPFGGFRDPFAFIRAKNQAIKNKGEKITLTEKDMIYFLAEEYLKILKSED